MRVPLFACTSWRTSWRTVALLTCWNALPDIQELVLLSSQGGSCSQPPRGFTWCTANTPSCCRGDCCAERLTNFEVRAGFDDPSSSGVAINPLCASFGSTPQSVSSFQCTSGNVPARYVSVQLLGTAPLTLCEVQVCCGFYRVFCAWALHVCACGAHEESCMVAVHKPLRLFGVSSSSGAL